MDISNPLIKINEVLLKEDDRWLHFSEPSSILVAKSQDEVLPALREIERLVEKNRWHAAGFLSYEAASAFDPGLKTHAATEFPYLWFGLYQKPRVITLPKPKQALEPLKWHPTVDSKTYRAAIEQIKAHISEGQTYQVNYTMRLQADFNVDAWNFFLHFARYQNDHAAFVDIGSYVICSASPELFFQLNGDMILCRPMKGTTRRGRFTSEDIEYSEWLHKSEKNRAENVMIVDMVRNDLGKIAQVGSVHVPRLFKTERYPTLWQMTSTVTANTSRPLTEILAALFPSASITGAPKVSTMRLIAQLENTSRKIYTGSIGTIAPGRKAKFNVAIRTVLIDRKSQKAEYGIGGGIVWDSTSSDEYAEALLKARLLSDRQPCFSLLETMLWTPGKGFFLRGKHLARMLDSAAYFDIPITKDKLEEFFAHVSSSLSTPQRVRVLLDQAGNLDFQSSPFTPHQHLQTLRVALSGQPIDSQDVFLFHKTTHRVVYEAARAGHEDFDDALLYNEAGQLTEFTIGNLVVELDGQLLTPPITCGVLPGTFRAHLLETGQVLERTIPVEQVKDCTSVFRVNSIRKWQRVEVQQSR